MSKELYDLCRRYKHFYNKNKDVESWNRKYHDIDLSDAVAITKLQVGLVEHDLLKQLFKDMNVTPVSINTSRDVPLSAGRFGRDIADRIRCLGSTSEIEIKDSERFVNVLAEYMCDMREHYVY